jgi:transcriptional regulator with XRE-family HTH domain
MTPPLSVFDAAWFRQRPKEIKVTHRAIAQHMGVDRTVVTKLLNGQRPLQLDHIAPLATALRVTRAEVLQRAGLALDDSLPEAEGQSDV